MFDFVKHNKLFLILCIAIVVIAAVLFFVIGPASSNGGSTYVVYNSTAESGAVAKAAEKAVGKTPSVYVLDSIDGTDAGKMKLIFTSVLTDDETSKLNAAVAELNGAATVAYGGVIAAEVFGFDYAGFFVSFGLIAVAAFLYGLFRFRKSLGVRPALLMLLSTCASPLLAAAFVINFRLYAYGGVYFGLIAVALAAAVVTAFCLESVYAGRAVGTAAPFSKDAVNASLSVFLYALVLPALIVFAALAAIGLVMMITTYSLAASAAFTVAAAVFSVVFVPVFVAAPMLAKK